MWRRLEEGLVCSECYEKRKEDEKIEYDNKVKDEESQVKPDTSEPQKPLKLPLRKSTRMARNYKTRSNPYALPKPTVGRGRGRRGAPRRAPMRAPAESRVWHKTNRAYMPEGFLSIGDVVSLCGGDNKVYYAQLRGFLCDLFGEKMGVITWLLPTADRKGGGFNPVEFYVGPDEDTPRRLETMELEYRFSRGCSKLCKPPTDLTEHFVKEPVHV